MSVRIAVIHVEVRTGYGSEGWPLEQAFLAVRLLNWNICVVGQCGSWVQPCSCAFGAGWVLVGRVKRAVRMSELLKVLSPPKALIFVLCISSGPVWGSSSLLSDRYREIFSWVYSGRRRNLNTHSGLVSRLRTPRCSGVDKASADPGAWCLPPPPKDIEY